MRAHIRPSATAVCLLACLAAGCGDRPTLFVQTTIHPDGSCDRMIWQPKDQFLPKAALQPAWNSRWKSVVDATGPHGSPGAVGLKTLSKYVVPAPDLAAELPAKPGSPTDQFQYFIATGSFHSPGDIPTHYRYAIATIPDAGVSELRRTYEHKDYGFVTDNRWTEKITDNVTLPGFLKARDELLDLLEPLVTELIENEFGKDYDVSKLIAFLRTNARRFLEEASLVLFAAEPDARLRKDGAAWTQDLLNRLAEPTKRHLGVDLLDEQGKTFSDQVNQEKFQAFLIQYIRHRDGSLLNHLEAVELFKLANSIKPDPKWGKPFEERLRLLLVRMGGLHNTPFVTGGVLYEYEFVLRLPGRVIETNGVTLEPDKVRWKFIDAQMFPDGYEMKARSIAINEQGQKKALGRVAITSTAKALEFIDLVGEEGPILEAVRKANQAGNAGALDHVQTRTFDETGRLVKLRKMLAKP